jgi:hypothetical protein
LLRFCMRQNIKLESRLVGSVQSTLKYHSPCALCRAVSILGTIHSVRAYRLLRILLLLVCFGFVRAIFGLLFALSLSLQLYVAHQEKLVVFVAFLCFYGTTYFSDAACCSANN